MPLSRLDNFLKNVRGNILYVDPNNLDATDSVENQGNSLSRPFKSLQRALIEAARFSYQVGLDNDRFEKSTIYLAPGEYYIDNRPGLIPTGTNTFFQRNGVETSDFPQLSGTSNFDLNSANNILYKFNSIHGGVIVPRGVSIVGQDLRKCKIKPLYVPNPENDDIERSAIFRVTGATYFFSMTIFDAPKSRGVFKDYTGNTFTPTFSHHKLTAFEYADGANNVAINDEFLSYSTDRTDLDMYYEKIGLAYGASSGREISPDYPSPDVDIQTKIDEFRIVGPELGSSGISSIKAGDGVTATKTITVNTSDPIFGLNTDTNVIINSVSDNVYNGTYLVTAVLASTEEGVTSFQYETPTIAGNALPNPNGTSVDLSTDTVSSASPYIFNISLRSIYGMCGMHADGSKASGFKSMVVAQFTAISLQVDDNAFVKYNSTSGTYNDNTTIANLHTDTEAKYKPAYANYHIKASNNSFIQLVSIFAIGFSDQFVTESGGDFSVTNSNSNFGQRALRSDGFRGTAFAQDDTGYLSYSVPPRFVDPSTTTVEFASIDVGVTTGIGLTSRMYLYGYTNEAAPPPSSLQGYKIGGNEDDKLRVIIPVGSIPRQFVAPIIMPNTEGTGNELTSVKEYQVGKVGTANSITSNTLTFTESHTFISGESVRVISDNGRLPDGLNNNTVYFAITDGLNNDQIRIAKTINDAKAGNQITINNLGGTLTVESRVSDKMSGDIGHPVQYDNTNNQWYVTVSNSNTENNIYAKFNADGVNALGEATPRSFFERTLDERTSNDRIFRFRYIIPKSAGTNSRPPIGNYVIQESNDVTGVDNTEVQLYYNPNSVTMSNDSQMRNFSFISNAEYDSATNTVLYTTELPHHLCVGSKVKIENITSTNFPTVGTGVSGYNGEFVVSGISSQLGFTVTGISTNNPGDFTNNTSTRDTSLPTFKRTNYKGNYYLYDVQEINEYVNGEQDGIYDVVMLSANSQPSVAPFSTSGFRFSQPVLNLYPQRDMDNINSNPDASRSAALPDNIGEVVIDEPKHSITRETVDNFIADARIGVGITNIVTNPVGFGVTIFTDIDHGLNRATRILVDSAGSGYGDGGAGDLYNARLETISPGSPSSNATARLTVNGTGQITNVEVMNGGSAYVTGDQMRPVGIATTTGFSAATLQVQNVYDNRSDVLQIDGISDKSTKTFNRLYRIVSIDGTNGIGVTPIGPSPGISTLGTGAVVTTDAMVRVIGKSIGITTFEYNNVTGLATVTVDQSHHYSVNNTVYIDGTSSDFYNGIHRITELVGLTTFSVNIGINTITPAFSFDAPPRVYPTGLEANGGDIESSGDAIVGRGINGYAGITTTLSSGITTTATTLDVSNLNIYDFRIGDYIKINNELMRIRTTVDTSGGNPNGTITVFRGVHGTRATNHVADSVIRRISVYPVELRRNSLIRASGHTFEYIGYGPGNYSTALPVKQTKQLTPTEQLNAQSSQTNVGGVNYTGMNDLGDYYIGNKKITALTGKEQVFSTPIQTITGQDPYSKSSSDKDLGLNFVDGDNVSVSRSIIVDGGSSHDIVSEFNGPVSFSEKIVSTSNDGIEANSIFIQGDAQVSRKITVGIATPSLAGNPGDLVYNANPESGGTVGWVFTTNNEWKTFGTIDS